MPRWSRVIEHKRLVMNKFVELTERSGARVAIDTHQSHYIREARDETCTIVFSNSQILQVSERYDIACTVPATGLA